MSNVVIVGMGALGILFGARIAAARPGSVRVVADAARIERYRNSEVAVNDEPVHFEFVIPEDDVEPADLAIVAVKSLAMPAAIELLRSQADEHTTIVSLLNGIRSESQLAAAFSPEQVLICVARYMDADRTGTRVTSTSIGELALGVGRTMRDVPVCGTPERLAATCAFFDEVGVPYSTPDDIGFAEWDKLICNVGINQSCMVCGRTFGQMVQPGPEYDRMVASMREVVAVGQAEGVALSEADVQKWLEFFPKLGADLLPSMAQDARAHRRSEVAEFGGIVGELGRKHGIATPANDWLVARIAEIQAGY